MSATPESKAAVEPAVSGTFWDGVDDGDRTLPELGEWFRPRNVFAWVFGFLERWFRSRDYKSLVIAIPFVVFGILTPAFLWWLKAAPQDAVVKKYEEAASSAIKNDDPDKASVYLEGLVKLRPNDQRYTFQLALHLLEHGQQGKGLSYLESLTVDGPKGYNPARLWLVRQAATETPLKPMTREMAEGLLRQVVESEPYNLDGNRLLAGIHFQDGKFQEAENRLLKVVERRPELSLLLAKVQLQPQLKRSREQVEFHLSNAEKHFREILLSSPENEDARVRYADALLLSGRTEDAERTLIEGLAANESIQLKTALSLLYLQTARQRLSDSILNRDLSADILVKACQLDPTNREVLNQIIALSRRQATFDPADLKPAIDELITKLERDLAESVLLAELLTIAKRYDEAVTTLEPFVEQDSSVRAFQASVHVAAGAVQQASEITAAMLKEFEARADELSAGDALTYANVLMMESRFSDARNVLNKVLAVDSDDSATSEAKEALERIRPNLTIAKARSCLGLFDQYLKDDSFADDVAAMQLLEEALNTNAASMAVLDKLVEVSTDTGKFSEAADKALTRLLAGGFATADIYNLAGTKFLSLQNVEAAKRNLERAYSLNQQNPMILNNLALSLIRQSSASNDSIQRALDLINEVLETLPGNADALSTRAEVLIALKRWEEARRDLEISVPRRKDSRNSRQLLVTVYDALGEKALADEHRRILESIQSNTD